MMNEIRMIPLSLIDPPVWVLREFKPRAITSLEMLAQVEEDGNVSQSILVRPVADGRYEIVDGLTRYHQLRTANVVEAPCIVQELDDREAIVKQVQLNSTRRPTDPIEYLTTFLHLLELDPEIKVDELANMFVKSEKWVRDILRLHNLTPKARVLVQRGEIKASNAYILAKVNQSLQDEYIEAACTMTKPVFHEHVLEVVNLHREAIKTANLKQYHGGVKPPHMRPMKEVKAEISKWHAGHSAIIEQDLETPLDGWRAGVLWVMSLDPESIKDHQKRFREREVRRLETIKQLRERNHRFDK